MIPIVFLSQSLWMFSVWLVFTSNLNSPRGPQDQTSTILGAFFQHTPKRAQQLTLNLLSVVRYSY